MGWQAAAEWSGVEQSGRPTLLFMKRDYCWTVVFKQSILTETVLCQKCFDKKLKKIFDEILVNF